MTTNQEKSLVKTSSRSSSRCTYLTSDGRRCTMLRRKDHPEFCPFHAREQQNRLATQRFGAELASSITGQFMTATDINFVLGKLFTALAQGRISRRDASTLAFIGQLMLHSLHDLKEEYAFEYEYETWNEMLEDATTLSNSSPDDFSEEPSTKPPSS